MTASKGRFGLAAAFMLLALGLYLSPLAEWVAALVEWGQQHPVGGPVAYVLFVAAATVLFLPGSVAMMIGGFLFGFLPGLLFAALAIPLGAQCAFEFGRWVARPWARKKIADNERMQLLEVALRQRAFLIIVLTRLSLIIPFNLLNYAFGATAVSARNHLVATAVGMLPAVALYVYLGTLARNLGQIMSGDAAPPALGYWIIGVGLIAVTLASWIIHRTATRVLEQHLNDRKDVESTG